MKVIGYIRVSTEEQLKDGKSLPAQEAKIRAYCDLFDLELIDVISDGGQSAKSLRRPGIQTALGMLKSGFAQGLVVVKLDRLSRSVGDWALLIKDYFGEKASKNLFSVSDSIDTRTAAGRLVLNVLMSVAQWEREAIGERTKDTLDYLISQDQRVGEVKYGHALTEDGKTLRLYPAEQAVVGRIRQWRSEGLGAKAIAKRLTDEGVPTKKGKTAWHYSSVRRIVSRHVA
jgi:DNA invertase Pin-like site-specific DNA recombinase